MGAEEIALLTALLTFGQAAGAYLSKIQPSVTNVYGQAAIAVGLQVAANITQAAKWGLVAADAEFTATNKAEKTIVANLATLPPIT